MSTCVTTCAAEQATDAPGASPVGIAGEHAPSTTAASVTVTPLSVWFPVLVTMIEKVIASSTAYGPEDVTFLTTPRAGVRAMGTVAVALPAGVSIESAIAVLV